MLFGSASGSRLDDRTVYLYFLFLGQVNTPTLQIELLRFHFAVMFYTYSVRMPSLNGPKEVLPLKMDMRTK